MGSIVADDQSSCKSDDSMPSSKVKFLCSHGGRILPRPVDGHLRYVGGESRIVAVDRGIGLADLMRKLGKMFGTNGLLKYRLPSEDLDTLVTIRSDEDLENMMEEHDRFESCKDGMIRLRAFLFPLRPALAVLEPAAEQVMSMEQRYVDAVNGVRTVCRLQVESPGVASPSAAGSPFKAPPDSLFGFESPALPEIECLSPTAPSDPGPLTPSPTHGDSNARRRNGATRPPAVLYDDANYPSNCMRRVPSEGRMATAEPQEIFTTTRFHREKENPAHNMPRVHSSPNLLQQYQYVQALSPTYRARRIIKGPGSATSKVGPPLYNNNNNNNNNNNIMYRPPGSLLRYGAQRVVNPPPQIVYVARPCANPEQVIKAVHFSESDGSGSSGEEALNTFPSGGHHPYLRVIHNNNFSDNVEYQ